MAKVATVTKQVMNMRINKEYSERKFLKIIQTTSAQSTRPHIFMSFISKIEHRCKSIKQIVKL